MPIKFINCANFVIDMAFLSTDIINENIILK